MLIGPEGNIVEGNEAALTAYGYSAEELRGLNIRDLRVQEDSPRSERRMAESMHRRKNGATFPVEVTGRAFDVDGKRYRQTFVRDISERKALERQLQRVLRMHRALQVANSVLLRAKTEAELYQAMCDAIVGVGGYRMATVDIVDQSQNKTIRRVAIANVSGDCSSKPAVESGADPGGGGLASLAIESGAIKLKDDLEGDPSMQLWRDAALRRGDHSIISVPLRASERIFGVLTLYAAQPNAFDTEEFSLLADFANDISYGVAALRARAGASRATDG